MFRHDLSRTLSLTVLVFFGLGWSENAHGKERGEREEEEATTDESGGSKLLAAGAVIVPGVLVHGAGSWVDGDRDTGWTLLTMQGVGLGLASVGGIPLMLTGASRYLAGPSVGLVIVGGGLVAISFAADVYAIASPEGGWGEARRVVPSVQTEVGYRRVWDPRFSYRHFLVQGLDIRWDSLRFAPQGWWSLDANNARVRMLGGYRFLGPKASTPSRDGSALDIETVWYRHRFGDDGFRIDGMDFFLRSRTDLERLAGSLAGSFMELGLGVGVQRFSYQIPGVSVSPHTETMLLGRFGFGMYVGGPKAPDGEFLLFYDHRHDDFAAGWISHHPWIGVFGHFGLDGRYFFDERWGISGQAQIGSALIGGLSLLFREDL